MNRIFQACSVLIIAVLVALITGSTGCANIIPPGGGPIDSLPPVLINAFPKDSATNFTGEKIVLNFDEYVDLNNAFENVIVSPTPVNTPIINNHLRTVTIKLRDTLEPNTTYSINFGNALRDINEGNVYKDFTYLFSTGKYLDDNTLSGKVVLAETGEIDSTLIAVLHRNLDDSAVVKENPRYITRLNGKGEFTFRNLPAGTFALYAVPSGYSKRYDDSTKPFAFAGAPVHTTENTPVTLYAFKLPKIDTAKNAAKAAPERGSNRKEKEDPTLRFQTNFDAGRQDLLKNLILTFSKQITVYDSSKVRLTDDKFTTVPGYTLQRDTTGTGFVITNKWVPNIPYNLIIDKTAFADSAGNTIKRNDTLNFYTRRLEDYGSVRLRFKNLDQSRNPVIQVVQNDQIIESAALAGNEFSRKLFEPGDYTIRILYDANKNGVWDTGRFFGEKKQPEIVITLNTKINVRANWDNEKDITL